MSLGQYFEISVAIFIACESSLNTEEQEKDTWKQDSEYSLASVAGKLYLRMYFSRSFFPLPQSATTRRSYVTLLPFQWLLLQLSAVLTCKRGLWSFSIVLTHKPRLNAA